MTATGGPREPERPGPLATARLLDGGELSHRDLVDFDCALALAREFTEPACAVARNRNPSGCATAGSLDEAVIHATAADALSACGGMVAVNREVDALAAQGILRAIRDARRFDGIVAPSFSPDAVKALAGKPSPLPGRNMLLLSAEGGPLPRDTESGRVNPADLEVVTKREPTEAEIQELLFAWTVARHCLPNSIVLAKEWVSAGEVPAGGSTMARPRVEAGIGYATVGVGAGQADHAGSVIIAARQAGKEAKGAALGSDAFFPCPDGVEEAGKAGVACIIQPGGSMSDKDTIAMADKYGMAMVFTGIRHFKH